MGSIVIIGAGQAGVQAAASARAAGHAGPITLIGEERYPPYQRPPLSKSYLQGELELSRLYLKPSNFFDKSAIALRLRSRVVAIDRPGKQVALASGELIPYDRLLIATGAPPRRLNVPGADLAGVHYLRSVEDCDALRPEFAQGARLLVVGAGYIGLEVAASARKAGLKVTIVEALHRPLARVAGPEVSDYFAELHRRHGVDLRFGASVEGFEGRGKVEAAVFKGGEAIACDAAVIGIGAVPATALAETAGLKTDDGVVVDKRAQSADPAIWAAGDCTSFPSPLYGRRMRLESVPHAIEQARVAGAVMAGTEAIYDAVPWFWSDQYHVKLQTAGVSDGADRTVLRRTPGSESASVWYFKNDVLIAVDAMNDVPAFAWGKRLIAAKARPDPKTLADTAADLKSLLA